MPSLTAILYCFRGIANAIDKISELASLEFYRDHKHRPDFEFLVLCLAPIIYRIPWNQWKQIAIQAEDDKLLRALVVYEAEGEPPVEGTDNSVNIRVAQDLITGTGETNAEWAWALGFPVYRIKHYVLHLAPRDELIQCELTEKTINRAFARLGHQIPFPIIKN